MVTSSWVGLVWTTVVALVSILTTCTEAVYLNEYILDYQPLQFDHTHLHEKHSRVRREVDPALRWNFKAYGRTFKLHLVPDRSVFARDYTVEFAGRIERAVDTSFFYQGSLTDVPGSSVHMSIHPGHVWGQVDIPGHTTYFIEPAAHHRLGSSSGNSSTANFHTIIYPESRMNLDPYRHKRQHAGACRKELLEKLKRMSQPVDSADTRRHKREASTDRNPYEKYSAAQNSAKQTAGSEQPHPRVRREAGELARTNNKTCFMQLRADKLLYQHYMEKYGSAKRTQEVIHSLFASHMRMLKQIFLDTTFVDERPPSVSFNGFNFVLQRSTIISECGEAKGYDRRYCEDSLDASNYLHLTSKDNHDEFCLVHTFTYRDFMGGTLGLAWVAEPDSPNAGFCGKYGRVLDSELGIVFRSSNTGITTLINYHQEVPSRVSQITFVHEVGHNFGAEHDETDECAPYGTNRPDAEDGNYIMFPSAIPGTFSNNKRYSQCSKTSIARVLQSVGSVRKSCFQGSDEAFCGNSIVEGDEQCDCGYKEDCSDKCCFGREGKETDCKLKPGKMCSPSQGLCCTQECEPHNTSVQCAEASDCTASSNCDGQSAVCPKSTQEANFTTFCNGHLAVCEEGECVASVCRNIGWQECFKTSADGNSDEEMCYISCRRDENSECISSLNTEEVGRHPELASLLESISKYRNSSSTGVKRPPGSPCDGFKGYCDVFSKCRKVDAEGPFKQLADLIFNPVTFDSIRRWAVNTWWGVLLICAGVVVFMGVFVWLFGYNTPSEDPRRARRDRQRAAQRAAPARGGRAAKTSHVSPMSSGYVVSDRIPLHGPSQGSSHVPPSAPYAGPYDNAAYRPDHGAIPGQPYGNMGYRPDYGAMPGQPYDKAGYPSTGARRAN